MFSSSQSQPTQTSIPTYFQTMSPVPADPQSTNAPPAFNDEQRNTASESESNGPESDIPEPLLRLELRDLRHEATQTFLKHISPASDVAKLIETVVSILYYPQQSSASRPTFTSSVRPTPHKPHIPDTRSVTLILRNMDGVAYTTGLELDDSHKEIHFSLSYISHVSKSNASFPAKITTELLGVICHELVHCYQYNGQDTCPGGLIEGIADFVRLRAGYIPPHWKREAGEGVSWDAGYQTTGYFLDWIERTHGEGSIRRLNGALRHKKYEEKDFWKNLFGRTVQELWGTYGASLKKDDIIIEQSESGAEEQVGGDIGRYGDSEKKMELRTKPKEETEA